MNVLKSYRVCVYVPEEALEVFVRAVGPQIPAFLGSYDHVCWWSEAGVEQFRKAGADEAVQRVSCRRFECSLPFDAGVLERFLTRAVLPNHPWKEPVITVCPQDIVDCET